MCGRDSRCWPLLLPAAGPFSLSGGQPMLLWEVLLESSLRHTFLLSLNRLPGRSAKRSSRNPPGWDRGDSHCKTFRRGAHSHWLLVSLASSHFFLRHVCTVWDMEPSAAEADLCLVYSQHGCLCVGFSRTRGLLQICFWRRGSLLVSMGELGV